MVTQTKEATPAEKRRALVEYAKKQAELEVWKRYEREREQYMWELRATWTYGHGNRTQYRAGCRCTACKEANAEYLREWRKNGAQPKPERRHGVRKYLTEHCRCDDCVEIYRGYLQERRQRQRDQRRVGFPHGTNAGYARKCRCKECRTAHAEYKPKKEKPVSKFGGLPSYKYYQLHPEEVPDHVHGTYKGYSYYGCRNKECCTRAWTKQVEARREKRRIKRMKETEQ